MGIRGNHCAVHIGKNELNPMCDIMLSQNIVFINKKRTDQD